MPPDNLSKPLRIYATAWLHCYEVTNGALTARVKEICRAPAITYGFAGGLDRAMARQPVRLQR
jgi:hypothetical protein